MASTTTQQHDDEDTQQLDMALYEIGRGMLDRYRDKPSLERRIVMEMVTECFNFASKRRAEETPPPKRMKLDNCSTSRFVSLPFLSTFFLTFIPLINDVKLFTDRW